MSNKEHLGIFLKGPDVWNAWRVEHPNIIPDLQGAEIGYHARFKYPPLWDRKYREVNLRKAKLNGACLRGIDIEGADLSFADLRRADLWKSVLSEVNAEHAQLTGANLSSVQLYKANLSGANLELATLRGASLNEVKLLSSYCCGADFSHAGLYKTILSFSDLRLCNLGNANLTRADLHQANLTDANLTKARLMRADLSYANMSGACMDNAILHEANLRETDLSYADMTESDLRGCSLIRTDFRHSILHQSNVYGISAWDVLLDGAEQSDLIIRYDKEPILTVGDLEVAQFIYLLINNRKISRIIDSITSKIVLILGRFKRMEVLEAIWKKLLDDGYVPVLFTFDKPSFQDYIETVSALAHISRFVVADMTDPKIVLEEVPHIVKNLAVPVIPIMEAGPDREPTTLYNLRRNHRSLLETYIYATCQELLTDFEEKVVGPAEARRKEIQANA